MSSAASVGSPYRVPKRHDGTRSFVLAVVMHVLLFVFLWGGIRWQSSQPVGVEAEVWDMTTQQAAPKPPPEPEPEPQPTPKVEEPPPPPPPPPQEVAQPKPQEPDIALERKKEKERQEKLAEEKRKEQEKLAKLEKQRELEEQKKLEEKKLAEQKKKDDEKAKKLAEKKEADKLAKARDAEMKRILGNAASTSTGTAAKSTAPRIDSGYAAAIKAKVTSNVVYTGGKQDGEGVFHVRQLPTGEVISVRKVKSSGVPAYDTAVENAIQKSSPLPKKKDGTVEPELDIVFNLKDLP
ncbi:cell envelope integrity protein TolA [Pseudoduganella sp. RAF53_2]|jgi:colicin import membrane protein|uniref:cell envelope integrity protein TolA n=1 Tax=unclassified Pseudoduganella TaxID=2637179 RepID=UPI003F961ADE